LNMLMVYNAVANNGRMMKPYLVNSIREYGTDIKIFQPQVVVEKICSDTTLLQLKECMRAVVDSAHGTAHKIKDTAYEIAGKTGTAVTALDNKGYNKGNKIYQASFIGFFPADHPKYTMAVVIQNSNESKLIYGADVSGVVFKDISDKIYSRFVETSRPNGPTAIDTASYNYYGLKNDLNSIFSWMNIPVSDSVTGGSWRAVKMKNNASTLNAPPAHSSASDLVTPDVKGMGLKDAVYLLENKGLIVTVTGRGKVVNQLPVAGTAFKKNQTIALILN
jgi:cell division protein FtsI (penicillin-binding protein 3)